MLTSLPGQAGPSNKSGISQQNTSADNHVQESDFNNSLWKLAKTAELKKHTLTMQLQTAHMIAAQHALELRKSTLEDVKAQRNWLESEKLNLLKQLELINIDRDKALELETRMQQECDAYSKKLRAMADGEYAVAKRNADTIRAELAISPSRSLQSVLDEKSANYLQERRLASLKRSIEDSSTAGHADGQSSASAGPSINVAAGATSIRRNADNASDGTVDDATPAKKRGRPKGSKNKAKAVRD